jgi:hypothetical protein
LSFPSLCFDVLSLHSELKEWKEKFTAANQRVIDLRTQALLLKTEIAKLQRILQKEVSKHRETA